LVLSEKEIDFAIFFFEGKLLSQLQQIRYRASFARTVEFSGGLNTVEAPLY